MPIELSEMEQGIIKNEMLRKSHQEIAALLELAVESVAGYIAELVKDTNIITKQMAMDARKQQTKVKKPRSAAVKKKVSARVAIKKQQDKAFKESIKKQKQEAYWELMNLKAAAKNARKPRMYANIHVDYSEMIPVRIDHKTVIYAKPGDDIKMVKENFLLKHPNLGSK